MTPIQVQILAGRQAGRRVLLQQSPITFGREADNELVIDMPFVSRHHGELHFHEEQWYVVNRSPNGTRVGRKNVIDQPWLIRGTQAISIGDEQVLRVTPQLAGQKTVEDEDPEQDREPKKQVNKVWVGIGVYLLLIMGLIVFLSLRDGDGSRTRGVDPTPLTQMDIEAEILALPEPYAPESRRVMEYLSDARQAYDTYRVREAGLYRAHVNYQQAMAYSQNQMLDNGLDQRRHQHVKRMLIQEVTRAYENGVNTFQAAQYADAREHFAEVLRLYPAPMHSAIRQSAEQFMTEARLRQ